MAPRFPLPVGCGGLCGAGRAAAARNPPALRGEPLVGARVGAVGGAAASPDPGAESRFVPVVSFSLFLQTALSRAGTRSSCFLKPCWQGWDPSLLSRFPWGWVHARDGGWCWPLDAAPGSSRQARPSLPAPPGRCLVASVFVPAMVEQGCEIPAWCDRVGRALLGPRHTPLPTRVAPMQGPTAVTWFVLQPSFPKCF